MRNAAVRLETLNLADCRWPLNFLPQRPSDSPFQPSKSVGTHATKVVDGSPVDGRPTIDFQGTCWTLLAVAAAASEPDSRWSACMAG